MSNDSSELVILVKRFWADPFPNRQVQKQSTQVLRSSQFDLYVKFEFLLRKGKLFCPIKRVHTLFQISDTSAISGCQDFTLRDCNIYRVALPTVFESIDYLRYDSLFYKAKIKITEFDLLEYDKKYFDYPILKTQVLKKGVYMSFSEFRNNSPSIEKFKVEADRKAGKRVFDMSNNTGSGISKLWGYCDGENIYCSYLQYPLIKIGNTFEFFIDKMDYSQNNSTTAWGYSGLSYGYGNQSSFRILPSFGTKHEAKTLEPFQIDMETGKVF